MRRKSFRPWRVPSSRVSTFGTPFGNPEFCAVIFQMSQCVQVTPSLTADRTFGHDPTVWNGFDRGGDGLAASLAPNGEVAETGLGQVPHRNSIGEYKAKICTAGKSESQPTEPDKGVIDLPPR